MTAQFRFFIFALMLGFFLPNNIIAPVHKLSHLFDQPDDTHIGLLHCDVCHASPVASLIDSDVNAVVYAPYMKAVDSAVLPQGHSLTQFTSTFIRAPPVISAA